ncbi:ATP-binding cassette domain-containing protein [Candidatus Dojkabacteria bacterium]|nr:ATP-binding cassette domain-containing protein [Candidatus Dojkabacteria bacterium]
MLKVKNLTKNFPRIKAVKNVSFEVREGEIFSLIGPNGSGKTTIIKMLTGLIKPTEGNICVNDIDLSKDPVKAKAQIGYIPDDPFIWSTITGFEFLHLVGALFNIKEKQRNRKIPKLLEIFNLKGIEHSYFEDYSRGNKQKFTILAAFLHDPKVILIDEPIVGLDPKSVDIALEQFKKFTKQGGSILLVTHTLRVAEEIADRIGVLDKGRLVETGTIAELRKKAELEENTSLDDVYLKLTE